MEQPLSYNPKRRIASGYKPKHPTTPRSFALTKPCARSRQARPCHDEDGLHHAETSPAMNPSNIHKGAADRRGYQSRPPITSEHNASRANAGADRRNGSGLPPRRRSARRLLAARKMPLSAGLTTPPSHNESPPPQYVHCDRALRPSKVIEIFHAT